MKRDIKLNMGMLSETAWKIEQYLEDLERIENASGVFLEKLKEQNSVSYETLSAEWNSGIMETEGEIRERLQFLKDLLDGYIAEMESFVAPENEDAMMRVDRNDIWWNLKQIDGDLSHLEDICMSIPSSYADYRHCIMDYWTDNEAAIRAEEDAEQARRERNYQKLSDFQNMIRSVLIPNMEDKMSQLWNIYQDAIVEFENTDDIYHDKAAFYYDMWSDFGDGLTDLWRGTKDVLRGAVDAVTDLGGGLLVLAMWSSPVVRVGQLFGMLPEYAEEKVAEMAAGIIQLLQDPVNTLGAIGQNMADTVDEEGLAYGISYVAADAAVEILLEKGLGKVMEGGSKLDEVTGHMDDVAAGAGKYADDVADAVTDVEKHVDDVTVIEGAGGAGKWKNPDSSIKWPPNNGAVKGTEEIVTMKPGEKFGRIGSPDGKYTAPPGTSPEKLSLAPGTDTSVYAEYEVVKEIPNVNRSEVAPWFDQPGGGIQNKMPQTIRQLERDGYIKKLN